LTTVVDRPKTTIMKVFGMAIHFITIFLMRGLQELRSPLPYPPG
jgi:hypothetical protein